MTFLDFLGGFTFVAGLVGLAYAQWAIGRACKMLDDANATYSKALDERKEITAILRIPAKYFGRCWVDERAGRSGSVGQR